MSRPLTVQHILSRAKTTDYSTIKSINLWGNDFDDIALISKLGNLEKVQLAMNKVSTLRNLSQCNCLVDLNLRRNNISDEQELQLLQQLPNLKNLILLDNPIASISQYREAVIYNCQALETLDEITITPQERENAHKLFQPVVFNQPDLQFDSYDSIEQLISQKSQSQIQEEPKKNQKKESEEQQNMQSLLMTKIQQQIEEVQQAQISDQQSLSSLGKQMSSQQSLHNNQDIQSIFQFIRPPSNEIRTIEKNQNLLCAIFSILKELDKNSIIQLKKEVQTKIQVQNI